jgi:pyrimidine operon attenuation protein/uracil phosphoribosyltransferase
MTSNFAQRGLHCGNHDSTQIMRTLYQETIGKACSPQVTNILLLVHVPKGQSQLPVLHDFRGEHMGTPRQQELVIPPG